MPAPPPEYIERPELLRTLVTALDPSSDGALSEGITALAGMGGVGKTTLAIAAAQALLARGVFSRCLWLDLRGYSHDTEARDAHWALDAILRALEFKPPETVDERSALYRDHLERCAAQRKPTLVVADNTAPDTEVELLRPPGLEHRLLVISRERLALTGTHFLDVDILGVEEATELLAPALRSARPEIAWSHWPVPVRGSRLL